MQAIKRVLEANRKTFASHPLFDFLMNQALDPRQRLFIAPCMAHFAMSLADINRYICRDLANDSMFQQVVNERSREEERYSAWFLSDYKRLGFDELVWFSDAMRFLWGRETMGVRRATYELCAWLGTATPLEKYLLMEAIEGHTIVLLSATAAAASDLSQRTGETYVYFGEAHLSEVLSRAQDAVSQRLEQAIGAYVLTDAERARAELLLQKCAQLFTRYSEDLYQYATTHVAHRRASAVFETHLL